MKYIITKDRDVVIFSEGLVHADVARKLFGGSFEHGGRVVSAGFVGPDLKPYGDSYSLSLGVGPDDEQIIHRHFHPYD